MIVFIAIVILLLLGGGAKFSTENSDYISKQQCNVVKGVCILFVFLSHAQQYILQYGYDYSRFGDSEYLRLNNSMGQLIVVMFLFYSGYGVMESFKYKGDAYQQTFPRKRILTTILNFDIAVLFFTLLYVIVGNEFQFGKFFLALLGWESIGNSNWYIFDIVLCYFSTWLAVYVSKKWSRMRFLPVQIFFILGMFIALYLTKETWWYDTLAAYLAGVLFSLNRIKIEKLFKRHYLISIVVVLMLFLFFHTFMPLVNGRLFSSLPKIWELFFGINGNLCAVCLAATVILFSMRVKFQNRWLEWFGIHLFPLYIYQRLAMIIISQYNSGTLPGNYPYLFIISSFVASCMIAHLYKFIQIKG